VNVHFILIFIKVYRCNIRSYWLCLLPTISTRPILLKML